MRAAAGFVKGWLESREIDVEDHDFNGLPVLTADVGPRDGPTVVVHGHLDVVPGHADQFKPRVEGDRLIGRGAYDMKGALAAMMCALQDIADEDARARALRVRARRGVRGHRHALHRRMVRQGFGGDFAITGEPTGLHVGVQAKGVLACRMWSRGRPRTARRRGWATTRC